MFLTAALLISFSANAQLVVTNTMTPQQLVQNVFVGGGVTVSNISYTGSPVAIGSFSTGANATNLGISSGIILSTGNVATAVGPNNSGSAGTALNTPGDSLLNTIVQPYQTYDAAILEFDFIPLSDTIKFRFVFGSEEYPEFVNSNFNDVFGFFISGINPMGGMYNMENIALIPGTTTPISINTVNQNLNSQYYVSNGTGTTPFANPWIQYDGFTTVLTAWARVFPCIPYSFRIAIADAGDAVYDSGVFLEAYSFSSSSISVSQSFSRPNVDTVAVEGCSDAIVTFSLPGPKPTPTTIYYGIGGTAINGVDYDSIPGSVTVPAGQDSVNLIIRPILDSIPEPLEYVMLMVSTSPCTYDTIYVYIRDYEPMNLSIGSDTVVCDGILNLVGNLSGGMGPYSFLWSNSQTSLMFSDSLTHSSFVNLTVTDQCEIESTDSIMVYISKPVITTGSDTVCFGETALIWANASGAVSYDWSNGFTGDTLRFIPQSSSQYQVVVSDTLGCQDSAIANITVNPLPVPVLSSDATICAGDTTIIHASGGSHYLWCTGASTYSIKASPLSNSTYYVTVTSPEACSSEGQVLVNVVPLPNAELISEKDTICRGQSVELYGSGADYFSWSTGSIAPIISVSPNITTTYDLVVTNRYGSTICSETLHKEIVVVRCFNVYFPNAFIPGSSNNGMFGPIGEFDYIESWEMIIYDRWGSIVFKSNTPYDQWDGSRFNSGDMLPLGVYTYIARMREYMEESLVLYGTVHLMR